jgi:hypothetical protein
MALVKQRIVVSDQCIKIANRRMGRANWCVEAVK